MLSIAAIGFFWRLTSLGPGTGETSSVRPQFQKTENFPLKLAAKPAAPKPAVGTLKPESDFYKVVSDNARAALDGNGRAALHVYQALKVCQLVVALYGKTSDPKNAFDTHWANTPNAPPWVIDKSREEFQACSGFFSGNPFVELPDQSSDYDSSGYWLKLAYEDGDPVAQSIMAGANLARSTMEKVAERRDEAFDSAQSDINQAAITGDPEALFHIGSQISNGYGVDPIEGFAVSLAACQLGYDCSAKNNEAIFGSCVDAGGCAPGINFTDIVVQSIGSNGYVAADRRAQELISALSIGDAATIQQFVRLKKP